MTRPYVLLVDDDDDVRHMTRVSLGFEGFDVAEAENGADGLAAARERRPDAVILDVMMPGVDGLAVLREIRADAFLADLPVLLLTAKAQQADVAAGLGGGADDYVTKPFEPLELVDRVNRLLG